MRHGSLYVGSAGAGGALSMSELVSLEDATLLKAIDPDDGTERIVISYKNHLVRAWLWIVDDASIYSPKAACIGRHLVTTRMLTRLRRMKASGSGCLSSPAQA